VCTTLAYYANVCRWDVLCGGGVVGVGGGVGWGGVVWGASGGGVALGESVWGVGVGGWCGVWGCWIMKGGVVFFFFFGGGGGGAVWHYPSQRTLHILRLNLGASRPDSYQQPFTKLREILLLT